MVTGPGGVSLAATASGGSPVCSCCLASGVATLIAGSDGVTCSPGDLTPFSALLLSSLHALSTLWCLPKMTSGSAVNTSVWRLDVV